MQLHSVLMAGSSRARVLWWFVFNPHRRPRYPTRGVIKENYDQGNHERARLQTQQRTEASAAVRNSLNLRISALNKNQGLGFRVTIPSQIKRKVKQCLAPCGVRQKSGA